ncbi:MAG: recombinase family protein [Bacteroidota bacterium]
MNAVGYLRLSTRGQSKSLEYQENIIRNYCNNNHLKILEIFSDNGQSSYTFDRPDYLALEQFIKKHKGHCQYLVVLDHDRFSRNLPDALIKIAELERKYEVVVISTNERVGLDTSDPDVFMKRAFDYLMANRELLNIRARVRLGRINAMEHGRYLGKAPYGYRNVKSERQECYIEINQAQAKIVRRIFRDYLLGIDPSVIHGIVKERGFSNYGKNAIYNVLRNCTYAGLIKVPGSKGSLDKHVNATHKPIISEYDFWAVQEKLCKIKVRVSRCSEDFPLRGLIKCCCGRMLTAGWSKGRNKYYLYYKCTGHPSANVSGNILHEKFERILRSITFLPYQIDLIKQIIKPMLRTARIVEHRLDKERSRKKTSIERKIFQLEEKFIDNLIEHSVYQNWSRKLKLERSILEKELEVSKAGKAALQFDIDNLLSDKVGLFGIYRNCNTEQKHIIIHAIFRDTLTWEGNGFTASFFNPSLNHNLKTILKMISIKSAFSVGVSNEGVLIN